MTPSTALAATAAFAALAFSLNAPAADPAVARDHWHQWRGPLANGVAPKASPPIAWSETQNVKWKFKIPGRGASTPIIWGNQVFLLAAQPTGKKVESPANPADTANAAPAPAAGEGQRPRRGPGGGGGGMRGEQPTEVHQFAVLAIDRQTGRERWRQVAREELPHEGHHRDHGYASYSPVTDGEHLYVFYGSRGLHAYDLEGNRKWEKDLGRMRTRNGFGEGGSPALRGNVLVINWDHEGEDFIAAFDKRDGRELWRQKRDEPTTWTTPLIVEHDGQTQVVVSATGRIRSYDLETGRQLWECGGMTGNVIPAPVTGFGLLYAISGWRGDALLAIRLGRTGDLTDSDAIAWRHDKNAPYVPSPLLYGERLYFFSDNSAMISSFDAREGRPLIDAARLEAMSGVYASPVGADGRVYLVGRDGKAVVLKAGDSLEVLATNSLDDKFDASPAAVGRQLFLRGHDNLYCLEGS